MGTWVLVVAFAVEVGFAAYCLATQSDHVRLKSYLRIAALVAFIVFTLLSVIQWSFRWYLLAALLLIWAALGAWHLVRGLEGRGSFKAARLVWRGLGMLLLVFVAVTPALIFPQFKLPPVTGSHPVATVNYTYTDTSRIEAFTTTGDYREVNVEFWYPQDGGGPYPLVVFSHGAFGTKTSNTSTFMDLASNGYVVCSIDHPFHSFYTVDAAGRRTVVDRGFLQEFFDMNNDKYDQATELSIQKKWMSLRTADINFVVDTILSQVNDPGSEAVYRLIDPGRIGLMGHSLGGAATAQVARERKDIRAEVDLDADLIGDYLDYIDGKYVMNQEIYHVPILIIYADDMVRLMNAVPDADHVIAAKRVAATAPNAYEVHLEGTNHLSLTDMSLFSPFLVSLINASVPKAGGQAVDSYATLEKMNEIVLKFFNAYLKNDGIFSPAGS
jgi:dienelactone hydrolase